MLEIIWILIKIFWPYLLIGLVGAIFMNTDGHDYNIDRAYWEWDLDF